MDDKTYREKNEGYITSSKMKCFMDNPEEYILKFMKEQPLNIKPKKSLMMGTMFDDYMTLGKDGFGEKYMIMGEGKRRSAGLVCKETGRQQVTHGEWLIIEGMINEIKRQTLSDWDGEYEAQKEIVVEYTTKKGKLSLKGTLDRLSLGLGLIRDWKTSSELKQMMNGMSKMQWWLCDTMEDPYHYRLQMAFYYILVKIKYGKECDAILDIVSNTYPHQSEFYKLDKKLLERIAIEQIIPTLDKIIEFENSGKLDMTGIDRTDAFKSDYYPFMSSVIQQDFILIN